VLVTPRTQWQEVRDLVRRELFRGELVDGDFRLLLFGAYLDPTAAVQDDVLVGDLTGPDGKRRDVVVDVYVPRGVRR